MDEILIKSELDKKWKNILFYSMIVFLALAVLCLLIQFSSWGADDNKYVRVYGYTLKGGTSAFDEYVEKGYSIRYYTNFWSFAWIYLCFSFTLFGLIAMVIYFAFTKSELIISNMNVKGKSLFGKEVALPLYMVSAYSTRSLFSTIAVATASGFTKFYLISNYKEIGEVLTGLLNDRQKNTEVVSAPVIQAQSGNSVSELKELKDLLDAGVITQEEFDAKKKQVLGL